MIKSLHHLNIRNSTRLMRPFSMISPVEQFSIPFKPEPLIPSVEAAKTTVLSNGISVITKGHTSSVASIKLAIAAGSAFESGQSKGCASFLGNTAFIGTANKSGLRLVRDLENLGVQFQSSADRENVTISFQAMSDKVEQAFAIIAETITSPPKTLHIIDEAKDRVQLAYDEFKASPMKQLDELIHEVAFGESSPIGLSFYADSLEEISSGVVQNYRSNQYKSGNLKIYGNGVQHEALCALAECYFLKFPTGSSSLGVSQYEGGEVKVKADLKGLSYSAIAFAVPKTLREDASIIFSALSKRMTQVDVPKGSLTPFYSQYADGGLIGFFAGGGPSEVSEYLKTGVDQMKLILKADIDLNMAIKETKLKNAIANDSMGVVKLETPISSTKESVVRSIAVILGSKPSYVVYGKTAGTPSYNTISSWLK